jgi:hypothetical protein
MLGCGRCGGGRRIVSNSAVVVVEVEVEKENVQIAHWVLVQVKSVELVVCGKRMVSLVSMSHRFCLLFEMASEEAC